MPRGDLPVAGRVAVALLLLVLGGVLGVASVAVHGRWWGLALAVAATAAVLVAVPGGWWRRLPCAVGWVLALLLLTGERPEGDFLVAGDVHGWPLLGTGALVLVGGLVGVRPAMGGQGAADADDSGSDPPTS